MKNKIALLTDSSSSITPLELKKYDIHLLPLHIMIHGNKQIDDVESELIKNKVEQKIYDNEEVSTSQNNAYEFGIMWDKLLKEYDQVFFIGICSNLSSQYSTAFNLAETPKYKNKVFVFDNFCPAYLLKCIVINLSKLNKTTKLTTEIVENYIKKISSNSLWFLMPGDMKKMSNSGRLKTMINSLLSLTKIKILIKWENKPKISGIGRTFSLLTKQTIKIINKFESKIGKKINIYFFYSKLCNENRLNQIRKIFTLNNIKVINKKAPSLYLIHSGIETKGILVITEEYDIVD